nr:hypothetical protein HK105_003321 [Polyrhizophydium stewartii]
MVLTSGLVPGILWKDEHTLWSGSKDMHFCVQDLELGYRPESLLTKSAHGWSVFGHMAFVTEKLPSLSDSTIMDAGVPHRPSQATSLSRRHAVPMARTSSYASAVAEYAPQPSERPILPPNSRQVSGFILHNAQEVSAFMELATTLKIDGMDIQDSCAHNAAVRARIARYKYRSWFHAFDILEVGRPANYGRGADTARDKGRRSEGLSGEREFG